MLLRPCALLRERLTYVIEAEQYLMKFKNQRIRSPHQDKQPIAMELNWDTKLRKPL